MNTRILRFEKRQDSLGNDEIFMHVEVNTGTALYNRAEWLTLEEVELINSDSSKKIEISQQIAERAIISASQQQTDPPFIPPVFPSEN